MLITNPPLHGKISVSPQGQSFEYGTTITLTAIPDNGYHFVNWVSAFSYNPVYSYPTITPTTLDIRENDTISAVFQKDGLKTINDSMIFIPGGTFLMGDESILCDTAIPDTGLGYTSFAFNPLTPTHYVTVSSFFMSATECTQGKYKAVMDSNPSLSPDDDNRPVDNIAFYDAILFVML